MKTKIISFSTLAVVAILLAPAASAETVQASFYGERNSDGTYQFHGQQMASGPAFDMYDPKNAAHKTLPFCTRVKLENPENGRQLTVVIMDRGPFTPGRDYDLSKAAARSLDFVEDGVVRLEVVELIKPERKHRYGEECDQYFG